MIFLSVSNKTASLQQSGFKHYAALAELRLNRRFEIAAGGNDFHSRQANTQLSDIQRSFFVSFSRNIMGMSYLNLKLSIRPNH